ncbi:Y-family DNA polymerase [Halomonas ramblicola]|uniref:Y-family DNA polymerase n=1 Tax=Halomonas ramblicola TaxID=747349 RepID=UPI0025B5AE40|nr:Y-family DNA polymerase [Halomonas ramblicola]MDN3520010.1 Y-family DNA polymerase [Halomonas ramblicola]
MFGLIDGNNFYVSCERVFQPRLLGRPVGVMSNNDGCVVARSEELKALGVAMGTPAFELRPRWRRGELELLSSNYELYADMSRRVRAVLEELCAGVEPYSIDEMFIRCEGFTAARLHAHARDLHRRVHRYTGIPVSVGIAPTRTLAKLANRAAKALPGYDGVCVLSPGSHETQAILRQTPMAAIWGLGQRLVERLALLGIHTARDLAEADPMRIRRHISVVLERTALELRGVPCIEMHDLDAARQRIMTSRSFGRPTGELGELREAIRQHAQRGAEKLRTQHGLARAVHVFLKTDPHRPDLAQYSPAAIVELARPSDDSREIIQAAQQALTAIHRPNHRFMKAGVMLLDLVETRRRQLSLLDAPQAQAERERSERLMATLDEINRRMGRGTVTLGRPRPGAAWQLRCAHLSNRWTTRWDELPVARC